MVKCPCSAFRQVDDQLLRSVSTGELVYCNDCGQSYDVWPDLVQSLDDRSDLWHGGTFAGANSTMLVGHAYRGHVFVLDLTQVGIPVDSSIHRIVHTVQSSGNLAPDVILSPMLQSIGNRGLPTTVYFFPATGFWSRFPGGDTFDDAWQECEVAFTVVWSDGQSSGSVDGLMLDAFIAFGDGDYKRAILDCYTAVDLATNELSSALESKVTVGRPPKFGLSQRMAVASRLCEDQKIDFISADVVNGLKALKQLRDGKVAHGGQRIEYTRQVSESMAAGLVTVKFFESWLATLK